MADEHDRDGEDRPGPGADRAQDPRVERLRPDPTRPATPARVLLGFFGDSDRPGFRRLYFTRELDSYAEFRIDDVLDVDDVPAHQQPFVGDEAARVWIRRDAAVDYTRTQTPRPVDEFDLEIRLASGGEAATSRARTLQTECQRCPPIDRARTGKPTCDDVVTCDPPCLLPVTVRDPTCERTCGGATCDTGCCVIVEPHPSQIDTACDPCPRHR